MSFRYISPDWIYAVSSARIRNGVVVIDNSRIIDIISANAIDKGVIEHYSGIIIPGFINTHCHLELSHLKGKIGTGTGLLSFIYQVVKNRDATQEEIDAAISEADDYMWLQGIQAVGDICNKADTFAVKQKSKIFYYSFVEMFDFLQGKNSNEYTAGYKQIYQDVPGIKSAVPHAPYSVSPQLFKEITSLNPPDSTISIHNQETLPEEELFISGTGEFLDFYKSFGLSLNEFKATGKSSIHYAMENMDPSQRTLFVHNTLTSSDDIGAAHEWSEKVFWATCPNANLYIENRLPRYSSFIDANAKMTIGTDSLTSNWQLSILEEMKTIAKYQSFIDFDLLLEWATLNGAKALGKDDIFGSLEKGKSPGLLNLQFDPDNQKLFEDSVKVKRVV